ncbi:MAG: Gfo/Idh/MocA family oxidoreductase, partial [bacterium]|nr:Gfo/Idh/MocA family oxidoreductase [bacterium]
MLPTYTGSVVGAGSGGKLSLQALHLSARYGLRAVADLDPEARKLIHTLYPRIQTFATHQEMFAQCPTDVVCVSTWPPSHFAVTRDALKLPLKGIVVEKPLSDHHAEGCKVRDLIQGRNLPVVVPHGLLVSEHIDRILCHVRNGDLGNLKLIEIQCTNWDIINAGIHWLNFVVTLVDEPFDHVIAACDVSTRTYRDGLQVETIASTSAQTRSGIRVIMHTGDALTVNHPGGGTVFRLIGDAGDIEFYAWQSRYRIRSANFPSGLLMEVPPLPGTRHQIHLENLAHQIDRNEPDYCLINSSLAALELCEAAYISCRSRCLVTLPLSQFTPPTPTTWDPGRPYTGSGGGRDG